MSKEGFQQLKGNEFHHFQQNPMEHGYKTKQDAIKENASDFNLRYKDN
jgi:hypothetical protein